MSPLTKSFGFLCLCSALLFPVSLCAQITQEVEEILWTKRTQHTLRLSPASNSSRCPFSLGLLAIGGMAVHARRQLFAPATKTGNLLAGRSFPEYGFRIRARLAYGRALIISVNSRDCRLAPPTSPPSMSGWENNSLALEAFTLPPYRRLQLSATSLPYLLAIS